MEFNVEEKTFYEVVLTNRMGNYGAKRLHVTFLDRR